MNSWIARPYSPGGSIEYYTVLTHWGRDKMAAKFLTTISNAFAWMKIYKNPIKISLKLVRKGPINNIPALVQIMAWRRPGDKPLSEPMLVSLLTHICVTRPQLVKRTGGIAEATALVAMVTDHFMVCACRTVCNRHRFAIVCRLHPSTGPRNWMIGTLKKSML